MFLFFKDCLCYIHFRDEVRTAENTLTSRRISFRSILDQTTSNHHQCCLPLDDDEHTLSIMNGQGFTMLGDIDCPRAYVLPSRSKETAGHSNYQDAYCNCCDSLPPAVFLINKQHKMRHLWMAGSIKNNVCNLMAMHTTTIQLLN